MLGKLYYLKLICFLTIFVLAFSILPEYSKSQLFSCDRCSDECGSNLGHPGDYCLYGSDASGTEYWESDCINECPYDDEMGCDIGCGAECEADGDCLHECASGTDRHTYCRDTNCDECDCAGSEDCRNLCASSTNRRTGCTSGSGCTGSQDCRALCVGACAEYSGCTSGSGCTGSADCGDYTCSSGTGCTTTCEEDCGAACEADATCQSQCSGTSRGTSCNLGSTCDCNWDECTDECSGNSRGIGCSGGSCTWSDCTGECSGTSRGIGCSAGSCTWSDCTGECDGSCAEFTTCSGGSCGGSSDCGDYTCSNGACTKTCSQDCGAECDENSDCSDSCSGTCPGGCEYRDYYCDTGGDNPGCTCEYSSHDPDTTQARCEGCNQEWNTAGSGDCTGNACLTGCCGDDSGEYHRTRECSTGSGCSSSSSDDTCCDNANDCVYNGNCYSGGSCNAPWDPGSIVSCSGGLWSLVEDCSAKVTYDSDAGCNDYATGGYVRDYTTGSGDTCAYTSYSDMCSGNVLTEYCADGASYQTSVKDCEDYESNYCSGGMAYKSEWGCGGDPAYCSDDFASDTLIGDPDSSDGWYGGGDSGPGCNTNDDPASEYRDYSCSEGGISYNVNVTKDCDSQDGWWGGGNSHQASCGEEDDDDTLQERDYYTTENTGTCTYSTANCNSLDCDSSDGWYGGGDTAGCGTDPDSYWRDYYADYGSKGCMYNTSCEGTNPVSCDSFDVCDNNVCDGDVVKEYKDSYVGMNSDSCSFVWGSVVEDCSAKASEDSDGGKNYSVKGSVIDYTNCSGGSCKYTTYTDYCFYTGSDEEVLVEYFVVGAGYGQEAHTCDYECKEGACVEQECPTIVDPPCPDGTLIPQYPDGDGCPRPPTCCGNGVCEGNENRDNCNNDCKLHCTDTDGGQEYYVKGYTSNEEENETDYCENNYELIEYYCGAEGYVLSESWFCSFGCSVGACIEREADIRAVNITWSPENPKAGELVELNVTAYYSTNLIYGENVEFYLYDNGKIVKNPYGYKYFYAYLKPNTYTTTTIPWSPESKGEHKLTVVLDVRNSINETDETNNNASTVVQAEEPDCPAEVEITVNGGEWSSWHIVNITAGESKTVTIRGEHDYVIEVLGIQPDNETAIINVNEEPEEVKEGAWETVAGLRFYVEEVVREDLGGGSYTGYVKLKIVVGLEIYEGDLLQMIIGLYDSQGNPMPNRKFNIQTTYDNYDYTASVSVFTNEDGIFVFYNSTLYGIWEDMTYTLEAFSNMTDCEYVYDTIILEFKASPLGWWSYTSAKDVFKGEPFDLAVNFWKTLSGPLENVTISASCTRGCAGSDSKTVTIDQPEGNVTLTGFTAGENVGYAELNVTVSYEHGGREFRRSEVRWVTIKDPVIKERLILRDIDGFVYEYSDMWERYYPDEYTLYVANYISNDYRYYMNVEEYETGEEANSRLAQMIKNQGNLSEEVIDGQKVYLLESDYQISYFWISENFIVNLWSYIPYYPAPGATGVTPANLGQISGVTVVPEDIVEDLIEKAEEKPAEDETGAGTPLSITGMITGMITAAEDGWEEPTPVVSAYLNKYDSTIESLTEEDLLDIALKLQLLKVKFLDAEQICLEIADYYESAEDLTSADKFREIADIFAEMVVDIDGIKQFISENLDDIIRVKDELKEMVAELKLSIKEVLKKLVST